MAVPSSGQLRLNADINLEINGTGTGTNVSLNGLSAEAGFTAPNGMEEFYGYTSADAPSVVTNSATSVTTSSMTLNGNVTSDGGASVTSRGFYFGTSSNYASNPKYTAGSGTGVFSISRSVASNTTYYITAFAINSVGETRGSTISQLSGFNYQLFSQNSTYSAINSAATGVFKAIYYQNVSGGWNRTLLLSPGQAPPSTTTLSANRINRILANALNYSKSTYTFFSRTTPSARTYANFQIVNKASYSVGYPNVQFVNLANEASDGTSDIRFTVS